MIRQPRRSTLFPYAALFRSREDDLSLDGVPCRGHAGEHRKQILGKLDGRRIRTTRLVDCPECVEQLIELAEVAGGEPIPPRRRSESTRLNSSHANISYAVFC